MIDYAAALLLIEPGAQVSFGDTYQYETAKRHDGKPMPSKETLDEAWANRKPVAVWEPREFLRRFNQQTLIRIYEAANTNMAIRILIDTALSGPVHSNSPDLVQGMSQLVTAGLMSQEECDAVMTP